MEEGRPAPWQAYRTQRGEQRGATPSCPQRSERHLEWNCLTHLLYANDRNLEVGELVCSMAYTLLLSASNLTLSDACAEADRCLMKVTWYRGHLLHLPATIKSLPFLQLSYYLMKWVIKDLESRSKRYLCSSIIVKKYLFSDSCCFFADTFMYMISLLSPYCLMSITASLAWAVLSNSCIRLYCQPPAHTTQQRLAYFVNCLNWDSLNLKCFSVIRRDNIEEAKNNTISQMNEHERAQIWFCIDDKIFRRCLAVNFNIIWRVLLCMFHVRNAAILSNSIVCALQLVDCRDRCNLNNST